MRTLPASILFGLPTLICASAALADVPTIELIPGDAVSANDMSPDGRFVVGETFNSGPYIWDTSLDVMTILPAPGLSAVAVSDDGTIVLGQIPDPAGGGGNVAAIINVGEPEWQSLGFLGSCGAGGSSSPYELSADGSVAVGLTWNSCDSIGFRWTAGTGMQPLQSLANGTNRASVVSADGTVIGGFAQGSFSRTPAMWDHTGAGLLLDPPDGDVGGEIHGISDDGSMLLVEWNGDAVKWTSDEGAEVIGDGHILPGWTGIPTDITDDGTVVGFDILMLTRRAWIQPQGLGSLRDLLTYVQVNGASIPVGVTGLEVAQAVSTDGRYIIGHGFGTAWRITMASCPADLNGDGDVNVVDLLQLLTDWGTCNGICTSDLNDDENVNVLDLLELLTAWGPCN